MYVKGVPDYYKGEKRETGLFAGLVSQDGELRQTKSGKQYASCSVKAFGRQDGTAAFMTLKSYQDQTSAILRNLRKGDYILAAGVVESREYKGKTYTDMLVDFLLTMDTVPAAPAVNRANPQNRVSGAGFGTGGSEFAELSDDEIIELPF